MTSVPVLLFKIRCIMMFFFAVKTWLCALSEASTLSFSSLCQSFSMEARIQLRILEQAAGHLRWKVNYPPSQPVGSKFEPHWRPLPAKLPSFGGYSLETLPYLWRPLIFYMPCLVRLSLVFFLNGTTNSAISFRTLWTYFGWRRPATNQSA